MLEDLFGRGVGEHRVVEPGELAGRVLGDEQCVAGLCESVGFDGCAVGPLLPGVERLEALFEYIERVGVAGPAVEELFSLLLSAKLGELLPCCGDYCHGRSRGSDGLLFGRGGGLDAPVGDDDFSSDRTSVSAFGG